MNDFGRKTRASGSNRVKRGGSWNNTGTNLRSAKRNNNTPGNRNNNLGFRVGFRDGFVDRIVHNKIRKRVLVLWFVDGPPNLARE